MKLGEPIDNGCFCNENVALYVPFLLIFTLFLVFPPFPYSPPLLQLVDTKETKSPAGNQHSTIALPASVSPFLPKIFPGSFRARRNGNRYNEPCKGFLQLYIIWSEVSCRHGIIHYRRFSESSGVFQHDGYNESSPIPSSSK